jgi:NAD(P)H-hydrate epimerase
MENAGAGAARVASELLTGRRGTVLCLCGPGGNGGDAMVVARHLAIEGVDILVARVGARPSGDAAVQLGIMEAMGLTVIEIEESRQCECVADRALIVDGLYGTGLTRSIEGAGAALVLAVNSCGVPVLSLDIPSGLDCDTGEPLGPCIRARTTVTFAASKRGFSNPSSRYWTGDVRVVPIGAPLDWPPAA